jgi:hypothetical protein
MNDVVPHELEVRPRQQVRDVRLLAGEEIVDANDVMSLVDQPFTQMAAEKTCAAGYQNPLDRRHDDSFLKSVNSRLSVDAAAV